MTNGCEKGVLDHGLDTPPPPTTMPQLHSSNCSIRSRRRCERCLPGPLQALKCRRNGVGGRHVWVDLRSSLFKIDVKKLQCTKRSLAILLRWYYMGAGISHTNLSAVLSRSRRSGGERKHQGETQLRRQAPPRVADNSRHRIT